MELAFGRNVSADVAVSLPLGAGRVTRTFLAEQAVPDKTQLKNLRKHVRVQVREIADGSAGKASPVVSC